MRNILIDSLAVDAMTQRFNCDLHPQLKRAVKADLRFPTKATAAHLDLTTAATSGKRA